MAASTLRLEMPFLRGVGGAARTRGTAGASGERGTGVQPAAAHNHSAETAAVISERQGGGASPRPTHGETGT